MIGKSYFLLSLLQVGLSQEWKGDTPREVTAQEGSCVQIPCHYSYPSHLESRPGAGVWFNNENQIPEAPIAFHSKDHSHEIPRFRHRTRLSGDLKDGDCSLIINNISREDAGPYFFRIEFDSRNSYNYYPLTQLHVSDFTDKPTIFPAEIIAGKRVDVRCTFNTTCNGTAAPVLTWDTPTDVPGPVSNTVTQHGVTLTYTSVLTLIASVKHHGHTLSCRVRYPSVSSERTLVLTVQYTPQNLSITSLDMINVSSINIIEGNSAVIICSVESFPASNLMWRHLNVPMNRTSSNNELWLVILHVTSRDTGDYQCVAENEHGAVEGFITITVEYAPQNLSITSLDMINASSINIIEGNSAVIICSVESFPASNLMWRHLNVSMNRTRSNNELWLVIPHVTSRDTGDYQCMAENEHGAVEGFITITAQWRDSNVWKAGLLAAGICLSVGLSGFFIFKCVRKWSSTGRGHSAQAERVGSSTSGEQSDKSWKRDDGKAGIKSNHRVDEYQGSVYENCERGWALRNQKKDEKVLEMKSNRRVNPYTNDDLYANCDLADDSVYGNV
ncbi:sialic acid-binding Ig-like lectin 13 isoform X1 [Cetorhinus maximus]